MILFKSAVSLQEHLKNLKKQKLSLGFVPTMGALHQGHLSLVSESKTLSDVTVASIFVNPTQFNDKADFEKYPVTIGADIAALENAGCDILFLPSIDEIYPQGTTSTTHYDLGSLETVYEGHFRPGHFQGVCQVVERLLNIVQPDQLFMGQKDYQQCMVVGRLIEERKIPVKLIIGATTREASGLALSSRNMRLNDAEKENALAIFLTLAHIKDNFMQQSFDQLLKEREQFLLQHGFSKVDYVSIANAQTLEPAVKYEPGTKYVGLVAAFMGDVRLIDNMLLNS